MLFTPDPDTSATMALMDAVPQVHNLEFGALTTGSQGQRSASLRTGPLKWKLCEQSPEAALRMPFGKPTQMGGGACDRGTLNFSADTDELVAWADDLDKQIQRAAADAGLASGKYCPILRPSKKEDYRPTIAVKCQLVGSNAVKIWRGKEQISVDQIDDWRRCRAVPAVHLRGIWCQGHQWGPSIQVAAMYVQGQECPFDIE